MLLKIMSDGIRLHKLGVEKSRIFEINFDEIYDHYKQKAEDAGYFGDLKFVKERGKIIIYSIIELPPDDDKLIIRVSS
jgi:hypothetical protein